MCVCVLGGGGGRRRRGTKTVNVPFLIPQRALRVPLSIIQCPLEVPFFYKVTVPFFVPGVNTNIYLYIYILVFIYLYVYIYIYIYGGI